MKKGFFHSKPACSLTSTSLRFVTFVLSLGFVKKKDRLFNLINLNGSDFSTVTCLSTVEWNANSAAIISTFLVDKHRQRIV